MQQFHIVIIVTELSHITNIIRVLFKGAQNAKKSRTYRQTEISINQVLFKKRASNCLKFFFVFFFT